MKPPITMSLIVVLAISCSSRVTAQSSSEYYPLKPGSEWVLEGSETDPTDPTLSYKVIGTEKIDGSLYAKIESKLILHGNEQTSVYYERCEDNRIYRRAPNLKEELFFDFNAGINQSWGTKTYASDGREGYRSGRLIGRDMTVRVPAGEFDKCVVYGLTSSRKNEDRISTSYLIFWFAPGVGLVKCSYNIGGGVISPLLTWVSDLTRYTIPNE